MGPKIAVVGTTTWGTTLAIIEAREGKDVWLWARSPAEAEELNRDRENRRLSPGFPFPSSLHVTSSLEEAFLLCRVAILAVPVETMRENLRRVAPFLSPPMAIACAAKGLEAATGLRMSQVMKEDLPRSLHPYLCVLSGPNLSGEIIRGLPTATVVAAEDEGVAVEAQKALMTPYLRIYTNTDVVGVELGGALKNIIALGAGMADGLGYGDNAKAAFITRGLAEITRLGVAAGANPLTFSGLAGLGDLVATCSSPLSRNRRVGQEVARGRPLDEVLASLGHVAEGVLTARAALRLASQRGVEMPITQQIYRVLFEGLDPRQAVAELMGRPAKAEAEPVPTSILGGGDRQ